ncbi:MAG: acyl-CoA desaturase [Ignavibacteria bacterium]|nr:acyl-CoA desaturase [Ignavibacteria bacterium]HRE12421.1 acyl-CoA desaturase [Ignavibacteria bacterium]HRF65840.1 acyl-CoA desaturase [Ignavibacteria bacterium]
MFILFFIVHWYLALFFQTFFHHRYASHRAFKMNKFWERTFYVLAYICQGSSYMSPRAYAIMHRMHHAYTDTDKDPHSPLFFKNVFSMMRHTRKIYQSIFFKTLEPEKRFVKDIPDWPWFDRWTVTKTSKVLWSLAYIAIYVIFAPSYWYYLLLPIEVVMVPFHGAIVNWFAHKYGYRNFEMKNTSTNLLPVDVLLMGEAYHNDHHKHASAINFGVRWYELDFTYYIILGLGKLGIVKLHSKNEVEEIEKSAALNEA